jgi:hypothetical protein
MKNVGREDGGTVNISEVGDVGYREPEVHILRSTNPIGTEHIHST